MAKFEDILAPKLNFAKVIAPATPETGNVVIYAKTDGKMYCKDDAGVENLLGTVDLSGTYFNKTEVGSVTDGSAGADIVGMTPITETGANATIQSIIEALIERLKAVTDSASGADLIGATEIAGFEGHTTVQSIIEAIVAGGLASAFTDLIDAPASYTNQGSKLVAVKATADGLEFIDPPESTPLTTKGDLLTFNGTQNVRIGVGTDGQVLTADSTQEDGVKWATPTSGGGGNTEEYLPYDTDASQVWYRHAEGVSIQDLFDAGVGNATLLDSGQKTDLNCVQSSVGYHDYEWPQCFWFNFPQAVHIDNFCILYGYADGRAGDFSNLVIQASNDSTDGADGTWSTGTWNTDLMPSYDGTKEQNTRAVTFDISDYTWIRIGTTGVPWSASPLIYSILLGAVVSGGIPLTTKGDLLTFGSTTLARFAVGSDGQILTADSTQEDGIKWADAPTGGGSSGIIVSDTAPSNPTADEFWLDTSEAGPSVSGGGFYRKIDIPPLTPDAMDDEFNGATLDSKWTILNQYTGQTIDLVDGFLVMETPMGMVHRRLAVVQSTPSGNWTIRAKMAIACLAWNFFGVGLIARRTTGNIDKSVWAGLISHSSYGMWSGFAQNLDGENGGSEWDLCNFEHQEFYLELKYDGTHLIWSISVTGVRFREIFSQAVADYLGGVPDQIGINLHCYDAVGGGGWGGLASFDWFRRTA
jgi:hypothetical protein